VLQLSVLLLVLLSITGILRKQSSFNEESMKALGFCTRVILAALGFLWGFDWVLSALSYDWMFAHCVTAASPI
jgi:hypothetical protein